ncbi:hypothetical protein KIW84_022916 [Lathyrus oleraceus]|uniref:Uncharacterized protein n=1 Tax=Pisum sativum TaxID=3888 RepID=A0A9D4YG21_PEA|nr:hypothetical protein KIW84_022916 [Pisum sativum]
MAVSKRNFGGGDVIPARRLMVCSDVWVSPLTLRGSQQCRALSVPEITQQMWDSKKGDFEKDCKDGCLDDKIVVLFMMKATSSVEDDDEEPDKSKSKV